MNHNEFTRKILPSFPNPYRSPPPLQNAIPRSNVNITNARQMKRPQVMQLVSMARNKGSSIFAIQDFVQQPGNFYVTFGGIGDYILILAEACKDPQAKIIFFCNHVSSSFVKDLINEFGIPTLITDNPMGTPAAMKSLNIVKATGRLMPSQHLSENLDYDDWQRRFELYRNKMTLTTDWLQRFGQIQDKDGKIAVIAPSGSFRNMSPQKFLHNFELDILVGIYLKAGYKVYCTGNHSDKDFYKIQKNPNLFWLTSNQIINHMDQRRPIKTKDFFQIINSADEICSVDTWLKTYTCLAGIPTNVFLNRENDQSRFGILAGDYIFLNTKLWPTMKLHDVKEFLFKNAYI
jgi:hypothetical protein